MLSSGQLRYLVLDGDIFQDYKYFLIPVNLDFMVYGSCDFFKNSQCHYMFYLNPMYPETELNIARFWDMRMLSNTSTLRFISSLTSSFVLFYRWPCFSFHNLWNHLFSGFYWWSKRMNQKYIALHFEFIYLFAWQWIFIV